MAYSSLSDLRTARDAQLASTDYLLLPDNQDRFNSAYVELIKIHRQQLRDITSGVTEENVDTVTLPDVPTWM